VAKDGRPGEKKRCHGANASSLVIKVPEGTVVKDFETGKVIADMSGENRREIILRGGKGGLGNMNFATATMQAPKYAQPGQEAIEIDLVQAVTAVCDPFRVIAKSNGINFNVDMSNSFNVSFAAGHLERVISNLLSNAVCYTPQGGSIWIYLDRHELIIENECEVIPDEQLSHIFEAFYRPDYGRGRLTGGNGLGLYIVSSILKSEKVQYEFASSDRINGMAFRIMF